MKELKRTKTIEEIIGYEAFDGKTFSTKEECEKYEKTAYGVIAKEFRTIMVNGDEFRECEVWEDYGYGSEEFCYAVLDIKTEEDLFIANKYYELVGKGNSNMIDKKYIGKRVMVVTGYPYDRECNPCPKTEEDLVEEFKKNLKGYFMSKEEIEAEKKEREKEIKS